MQTRSNTITIKNLMGGIIRDYVGGPTNAIEGKEGQYTRTTGIDLFRQGFVGHITPAQIFSAGGVATPVYTFDSSPRAVTVDITQNPPYVFYISGGLSGTAPKVTRVLNDSTDSENPIAAHGGHNFTTLPTGTGFWGEDIALYPVQGVNYVFYSWNDNSDGDIGRASLGGVYDDDYMSTDVASPAALTSNVPHRLLEAPNHKLYCTNGRYVAEFDGATGANGTFNSTKYDLGAGWIAVDLRNDKNSLVIAAVRTNSFNYYTFFGKAKVCYWDQVEPGLGIVYDIDDFFISAIFPAFGTMLYFSTGKNGTTKIADVFTNKVYCEFPSSLYGTPPKPTSIDVYQGNLCWIPGDSNGSAVLAFNNGGGMHWPFIVNDGAADCTSAALLKNFTGNNLYVGGLFAGTYKVKYANGTGGYSTTARDVVTRLYRLPYRSNIKRITAYFSQMKSGSSVQFSLFKNYTTKSVGTANVDFLNKTLTYSANGELTEFLIGKEINKVSAFYLNVRPAGQISIPEIEVEFEPSTT